VSDEKPEAPATERVTARGAATRVRIVTAAADLMYVNGVNATTLDDVRAASATSKSQLYRYFPDKDALVHAVIATWSETILAREHAQLDRLSSFAGLVRWRNVLLELNRRQDGAYGCALGSMAIELSAQDEPARAALADTFADWQHLIAVGLQRMQDNGKLDPSADPGALATGLMAALQGGYLLAQTTRDTRQMEIALDMALDHIRTRVVSPSARRRA
jgi:TetR/AcrR family transcriptional regulator, transcriptional repressor for nem operon